MSEQSQKTLKKLVGAALATAFVVFAVLFFTGRVGDFIGIESDTLSYPESSSVQSAGTNAAANGVSSSRDVQSAVKSEVQSVVSENSDASETSAKEYKFRSKSLLDQHYEKHGREMGFRSAEEYEAAASAVPNDPAALHKTEKEDGDDVYYIESTNEFVVISTDGYIRTYFNPDRGIEYYNKQ